jgi:hypothetical protein
MTDSLSKRVVAIAWLSVARELPWQPMSRSGLRLIALRGSEERRSVRAESHGRPGASERWCIVLIVVERDGSLACGRPLVAAMSAVRELSRRRHAGDARPWCGKTATPVAEPVIALAMGAGWCRTTPFPPRWLSVMTSHAWERPLKSELGDLLMSIAWPGCGRTTARGRRCLWQSFARFVLQDRL